MDGFLMKELHGSLHRLSEKNWKRLNKVLQERHPFVKGAEQTPKRNNKTQGYILGATFTRLKEFNPTSRDHKHGFCKHFYGWKPSSMTASGKVVIDEVVLKEIGHPIR
jgi:hypothetical protein